MKRLVQNAFSRRPTKIEKNQDFPPGLKISSEIEHCKEPPPTKATFLWRILKVEIENSGELKCSSEIENIKREACFFFKIRALRV